MAGAAPSGAPEPVPGAAPGDVDPADGPLRARRHPGRPRIHPRHTQCCQVHHIIQSDQSSARLHETK